MRILVTDGAGFVGSAVVRHCLPFSAPRKVDKARGIRDFGDVSGKISIIAEEPSTHLE